MQSWPSTVSAKILNLPPVVMRVISTTAWFIRRQQDAR
jgi:hypothetical protein